MLDAATNLTLAVIQSIQLSQKCLSTPPNTKKEAK